MLTPITGLLPDGGKIAMQMSVRFRDPQMMLGVEPWGPAYVGLKDYQWNSADPIRPYLEAGSTQLGLFTVTLLPEPHPYVRGTWGIRPGGHLLVLKAPNGKYVRN